MSIDDLIAQLASVRAVHPNAEVKFLISDERGEREFEISEVEYFHHGKVVLLQP